MDVVAFAQSLVRVDSSRGNETDLCKLIQETLDDHGIASERFGADPRRQSLLFRVGTGRRRLLLNGHLDTVPVGDEGSWTYPPLEGRIVSDKLHGRGASDMKGGLAALVFAAIALKEQRLRGQAVFVLTQGEETGLCGAREAVARGIRADAGIVADGNLREIVIGCRGGMNVRVTTHGRAAHTGVTSHAAKGRNAVLMMTKVLQTLETFRPPASPVRGFPPGKVTPGTMISGGIAENVIPDRCEASVNCRLTVGQTPSGLLRGLRARLQPLRRKGVTFTLEDEGHYLPYRAEADHPVVRTLQRQLRAHLGKTLPLGYSGGGTDANIFAPAGIPCAVVGVEGGNFHAENEWASVQSIRDLQRILTGTAADFLSG
ncbi:MAG: M20 family metallopeptidase [Candidatus Aenigmarchaeota archaeon]|nr:M20 family metallopeptidase [Candidatus Aenigmarchaeota archaeon]